MDTPVLTKCLSLLFSLAFATLGQAGYKPGPGWPEVSTPYYRAETPAQAAARLASWRQQNLVIRGYRDTGSMHPVLKGGREVMAMERCRPDTPLAPGQMVEFNRGDRPAVLHYIADVSRDGKHLYISGVNNRRSDGWFHRDTVAYVVREIIVPADAQSTAIAQQASSGGRQAQAVTQPDAASR